MEDNKRTEDQDQSQSNTTNEIIREVNGGPDTDLNTLSSGEGSSEGSGTAVAGDTDTTQGMSYNPNDTSGVRSGGTTDMDDQTAGGAGLNTGARQGLGSHMTPKTGTTGSDYDGQVRTS